MNNLQNCRGLVQVVLGLALYVAFSFVPAGAASFKCDGKLTSVEQSICVSPELSALDELMKSHYDLVRARHPDVVLSQRDWLKYGRNRCTSEVCLREAYNARIAQLKEDRYTNWAEQNMPELKSAGSAKAGISYESSSDYSTVAKWLRQNQLLEASFALAKAKYAYPSTLRLVARNCKQANAYYLWEREEVAICYELVHQYIQQFFTPDQELSQLPETQRLAILHFSVHYIIQHELGHAALHNRYAHRSLGNEESEADNFAFINLISAAKSDANLFDMFWGVSKALSVFKQDSLTIEVLTDEHDLSQRRYYQFACLASGANAQIASELLRIKQLDTKRVRQCQADWRVKKRVMDELLAESRRQKAEGVIPFGSTIQLRPN